MRGMQRDDDRLPPLCRRNRDIDRFVISRRTHTDAEQVVLRRPVGAVDLVVGLYHLPYRLLNNPR
jgi:hypothetical protein